MKRKSARCAYRVHPDEEDEEGWLERERLRVEGKYNQRLAELQCVVTKKKEYEQEGIPRHMLLDYKDICGREVVLNEKIHKYESGLYEEKIMSAYERRKVSNTYKRNMESRTNRVKKMKMSDICEDASSKKRSVNVVDITGQDVDEIRDNSDQVYIVNSAVCPACDESMFREGNLLTCLKCNATSFMIDDTNESMTYDDDMEYSNFTYKRLNHLNEWLNQIQCREHVELSDELLDEVMDVLYEKFNIRDPNKITTCDVREALKALKKRKYYENCVSILSAITNRKPPRLHPSVEAQIRVMFLSVQAGFQKHCPRNRRNFLSYAYVLYKFFELLNLDEYLCYFSLLKGADKLHRQDQIFSKLCEELQWEFIPSI